MGAWSSRARGLGQHRDGGPVPPKDAPRHQRQKPPILLPPRPRRLPAATTQQQPPRRASLPHDQGAVKQNASSDSGIAQKVDKRELSSVNDGRNSNQRTEASQVTPATKVQSTRIKCDDDENEPDVTCGSETSAAQVRSKGGNSSLPIDEEDEECVICLEGYSEESPKLLIQCQHLYHFHCILEWSERSPTCPICGRVVIFNGTSSPARVHVG